ncbi:MAG: hypothetical protein KKH68_00060 [Proteobacteria bacterium]|nr:hypothetical protein [Pseudomonadota bacterium]
MYEIIANPEDYHIEALVEGMGYKPIAFPEQERRKWAEEIENFAEKLNVLAAKAEYLQKLFKSEEKIMATPASLKTFKVQLFKINAAFETALGLANKLESELIQK